MTGRAVSSVARDWRIGVGAACFAAALASIALADTIGRDATPPETAKVVKHLKTLGYAAVSDVDVLYDQYVVDAKSAKGKNVDVILNRFTLAVVDERAG